MKMMKKIILVLAIVLIVLVSGCIKLEQRQDICGNGKCEGNDSTVCPQDCSPPMPGDTGANNTAPELPF